MSSPALARRLGLGDAIVIGLGSMIGAGVFAVFAPAARAAGAGLLLGLLIAAAIAYANAMSSARLAAVHPGSGGTYLYGRRELGHWWGFTAGWGFVIGKSASCAVMAMTFAAYAAPGPRWSQQLVAAAVVVALVALNRRGITKTAFFTRILVSVTGICLTVVVTGLWSSGPDQVDSLSGWVTSGGVFGVLQAAGLLFFAFAGYARIATLGEEVRDPARTIPLAIPIALGIAVLVYVGVAVTLLSAAGPAALAAGNAPMATAAEMTGATWLAPVIRIGAAVATLGALLGLVAGVGRTAFAMAREADLPTRLAAVHPKFQVPHQAESALGAVVVVLILLTDLRTAIGFSSFGVLIYYAICNAASIARDRADRRRRFLPVFGLIGCSVLVATLPWPSVLAGGAVLLVGVLGRVVVLRGRRRRAAR